MEASRRDRNQFKHYLRLTREIKAREERSRAHADLAAFANAIDIPGKPVIEHLAWQFRRVETSVAPHHRLLMETAQRIVTTPHGRGMILLPPGAAKSTYCSVVLPTWCMGRNPGSRIILASYGSDLARRHSRKARQIARSRKYRALFDATLSAESSAADAWALTNGSEYMAGGILSGMTGHRANGIVIDDPVKGRDEAESEVIRTRTREAYEDDIKTRLMPGGWIILIQTRWHEDDLAGSILPANWNGESGLIRCRDGFDWDVLCLPAKCERADDALGRRIGEYLWPEWFGPRHWTQFEANPRTWASLYQQRPAPAEGAFFKADWFRSYDTLPARETLHVYGASDYAVTADGGDYTVHAVVAVDPHGRMYLADLWRAQAASDVWIETLCDLIVKWRPLEWAEESGQINAGIGPFLIRRMRDRQAFVARRQFAARGDKAVRAQSIRGRMALDGLYAPSNAPWVAEFRRELLTFPAGVHDDQVDALGLIGQLLDRVRPGQIAQDETAKAEHLVLEAQGDGRVTANMSVREIVARKMKRRGAD
jgi:predicted phage terminase large subunit-like protein